MEDVRECRPIPLPAHFRSLQYGGDGIAVKKPAMERGVEVVHNAVEGRDDPDLAECIFFFNYDYIFPVEVSKPRGTRGAKNLCNLGMSGSAIAVHANVSAHR
jgi:hypothetical protein